MWSSWNFYTLLYKMVHLLWKAVCHFLKDLKCTPALWFSLSTPRHLFKRNECIWPHKDLYPNIHSSFICNRQNLKTVQVCVSSRHCALSHKMEYYTAVKRSELLILQQCVLFSIKVRERIQGGKRHSVYVKLYKIETIQKANQRLLWCEPKRSES